MDEPNGTAAPLHHHRPHLPRDEHAFNEATETLAAQGTAAIGGVLTRLCTSVARLSAEAEDARRDSAALRDEVRRLRAQVAGLEAAADSSAALADAVSSLEGRADASEAAAAESRWVDVDVQAADSFRPEALYRLCVEELGDCMRDGWVVPTRVLPGHLIFDPANPSASQYFARVSAARKGRWEFLSRGAESPDAQATPVTGGVYRIQEAVF